MKKLIFGLLATVLLSSLSYGKSQFQLHKEESIEIVRKTSSVRYEVQKNNDVCISCVDVGISYSVEGFGVSVTTKFCCWRTAAQSPHFDCAFFSTIAPPLTAFVDVEALDPKLLDIINEGKSNKISITKSQTVEYEKKLYKIAVGEYSIEKSENGRYIMVNIIEVKE